MVSQSVLDGKLSGMLCVSFCEVGGKLFGPRLGGGELSLEGFNMSLKRCYEQLEGYPSVQSMRGPPTRGSKAVLPPVREENARPFVVAQSPLPAASSGPVPRSVGRYSQQFGRLYVCVPIAGHGPCPWVGRDKSRLADSHGGVKV
jgi:hypothetical protein